LQVQEAALRAANELTLAQDQADAAFQEQYMAKQAEVQSEKRNYSMKNMLPRWCRK